MGINLLEFVKSQIGSALMTRVAGLLGENAAATQKAMDVLLPSVLGGMANQATTLSGADNLLGTINRGGHDGSIFDSIGNLLGNNAETQGLLLDGSNRANTLFGDKITGIVNWVASHSGVKTNSASSLMNLAVPILMGAVSKNLDSSRTASSLVSLLGSQLPFLKKAIPADLVPILGLSQLSLGTPQPQETAKTTVKEAAKPVVKATPKPFAQMTNGGATATTTNEKPILDMLKPWLLLLGAALVGLLVLRTCKSQSAEMPAGTPVVEAPKANVPTSNGSTAPATTVSSEKTLKVGDGEIKVRAGSFLDLLYTEINDANADLSKPLTFDNVNFAKYKTELTDSSKLQLADLSKMMKAFPKLEIKINGYTDSHGDAGENKKLSDGRAASVKSFLTDKGIGSDRIKSEGLGQAKPVGDNDTEAGRAKNRRIEVLVTKK